MARTSLHLEANYVKLSARIHQRLQATTPDISDILHIAKSTVHRLPQAGTKKKGQGKISNHGNYLEIIPETSSLYTGDVNSSLVSDSSHSLDNRSAGLNRESEDCDLYGNENEHFVTDLPFQSSGLSRTFPVVHGDQVDNALPETELMAQEHVDNRTMLPVSNSKFNNHHGQRPWQRYCTSKRSHLELKSGALVWISQGHCRATSRNSRGHHRLDSNNNNCNTSMNSCKTVDAVTVRTPVMLKVHGGSAGDFALLTPSRPCQGHTQQPVYLRLKHSQAAIDETSTEASTAARVESSGPCCFVLTLGGMEGKSFKFEASSREAALAWVSVLSGDHRSTFTASETASLPTLLPSLESDEEESVNNAPTSHHISCTQNYSTDNKNNNYFSTKLNMNHAFHCSAGPPTTDGSDQSTPHHTSQFSKARQPLFSLHNSNYYPSSSAAFQRDRVMPTLSESSDEDSEDC